MPLPPPTAMPFTDLPEAIQAVLSHLRRTLGFALCTFMRVDGEEWISVDADGDASRPSCSDVVHWPGALRARLASEAQPLILPCARGAALGIPIMRADGTLYGAVCALDPQAPSITPTELDEILRFFARLLGFMADLQHAADEAARRAERAEVEALLDPLTSFVNRRGWDRLLEGEEARCRRYGHPAHVFMLDFDDFKTINDTFGHAAGDRLLQRTAATITRVLRKSDVAARVGGDEFAILAVETDAAQAARLRERLEEAFAREGIAVSIGVAPRRKGTTLSQAWEEADTSMYADKRRRAG